jgi:hypothetical protein
VPEGGAILRVVPDQVNAKSRQAGYQGPACRLRSDAGVAKTAIWRRSGGDPGTAKEISAQRVRFVSAYAFFCFVGQRREPMAGNRSLGRWGVGLEVWQVSRAHAGNVLTW